MEPRSATVGPAADVVAAPRQRWRLVLARSADAPRMAGRELIDAWEEALETSGLPVHRAAGRVRTRVAFAAPLPLGFAAERELADVFLAERMPIWRVREALETRIPEGWRLVDLFDVWPAGPPLAGRIVAADYRIEVSRDPGPGRLGEAVRALLSARELPRVRQKGEDSVAYDLRPLLVELAVDSASPPIIRVRTRMHPELGTGRPEEVVAALGERLGEALDVRAMVREGLVLSGDGG